MNEWMNAWFIPRHLRSLPYRSVRLDNTHKKTKMSANIEMKKLKDNIIKYYYNSFHIFAAFLLLPLLL